MELSSGEKHLLEESKRMAMLQMSCVLILGRPFVGLYDQLTNYTKTILLHLCGLYFSIDNSLTSGSSVRFVSKIRISFGSYKLN